MGGEPVAVVCLRGMVHWDQGSTMHILKVVQAYYPFQENGGAVVKVRALARALARHGHEVTVLTADLGVAARDDTTMKIERSRWGWRVEQDGVVTVYLPTLGHYRALTINSNVIEFCRSHLREFDLVHFYGLYDLLGPTVSFFCRRYGIPYVIEPMGMNRPIDRNIQMKRLWHRCMGGRYWRNAARIVATSEMEQEELLEDNVLLHKIVMRYNGVDSVPDRAGILRGSFRRQHGISANEPLILFLSRLIPRKGADVLIQAFAQACPQSGRLVIAGPEGETGYRAFLEKCAIDVGVGGRVLFTGPIYDEQKRAVFVDSDLFALPSRYENFANAAAEAIAFGIPVIITPFCGIRSLVDGRAGLVVPPEKEPLADALRNMIDNKPLFERLREGCTEVAAQLSWDRLTQQMEGYYTDVLASENGTH
jgi:glycosyltransferase involved in cell wall biosynthesis